MEFGKSGSVPSSSFNQPSTVNTNTLMNKAVSAVKSGMNTAQQQITNRVNTTGQKTILENTTGGKLNAIDTPIASTNMFTVFPFFYGPYWEGMPRYKANSFGDWFTVAPGLLEDIIPELTRTVHHLMRLEITEIHWIYWLLIALVIIALVF